MTLDMNVTAPRPGPPLEPVSSRLLRSLMHPNKETGTITTIHFSPDSKQIVAGHYPGGIIQLWDVETGSQLTRIETASGLRASGKVFDISPDWKKVYATRTKQHAESIEKEGKKMLRWSFEGDIRAWNLATGELIESWHNDPPRYIVFGQLSPDGKTMYTMEEPPGDFEHRPDRIVSLWDVSTHKQRQLPKGSGLVTFSPDCGLILTSISDENGYTKSNVLLDAETLHEKLNIPVTKENSSSAIYNLSPDGKLLIGTYREYPKKRDYSTWKVWLKCWDASIGKEETVYQAEDGTDILVQTMTKDSKVLYCSTWTPVRPGTKTVAGQLLVFDLKHRRLIKKLTLQEPRDENERVNINRCVLSSDGKWLAVNSQGYPNTNSDDVTMEDASQSRIHLIDTTSNEVKEVLIAPQGYQGGCCFSPDGKLLATGGNGRVLLWDLSSPPGSPPAKK